MPLPNLTNRESLALDLEHTTENLWALVNRYAAQLTLETDDPARADLRALVAAMRSLDTIGARLAPELYRPAEQRRGPLDVGEDG
jgi:hypothetical protein